ncbi:DNA-binding protein RFX2 [Condylostylus longicornis]|uniref:DNA-binding protein RFX2 n=1 Tax=Condylostylus longicornis TaxID=2530218 RepID=UPI00244E3897|nr:DNA-binding protein RFX2 [Condylostylus longicornis]
MAARIATARNLIAITNGTIKKDNEKSHNLNNNSINNSNNQNNNSNNSNNNNNNNNNHENRETSQIVPIAIAATVDPLAEHVATANGITISEVITPKKIILQTNKIDDGGVAVIDVVPIEASDSSNEETVTTLKTSPDHESLASQLSAQVAVVQHSDGNESPQYITVTVSTHDNVGGSEYQVQYVNQELYQNNSQNQSQISYPFCAVGDYQSGNQSYYATTGNYTSATNTSTSHTSMPYIVPVDENILLASSASRDSPHNITEVYIQENHNAPQTPTSTTASMSETDNSQCLNHASRIAPQTTTWLMENYETAEGVSLPRSTLYNHYKQHCEENKLDAVNAASFGKLIRSVFTGLRTRRLGTRGNSKYHYYGIRVKPGSALTHAMEEKPINNYAGNSNNMNMNKVNKKNGSKLETYEACAQFLGDGANAIPILPNIDYDDTILNEITIEDLEIFRSMYREHCEFFLEAVLNLEFSTIESLWRDFWRSADNNNLDECEEEKYLSKAKLYLMCQGENVQKFIKEVDYAFYQNMVEVLIPDVLRSIPNSLTQAIRNFAKNLEIWLNEAMAGCPEKIVLIKTSAVSAFCQTLRRYTSLNHLAQAARAVLQNPSQIAQMLNDLNRVDFHNVQEQAAWVCQCDTTIVKRLETDFKAALQQQKTLEQWASWLQLVVDSALEEYRGKPNYAKAARQFLLKWSFYSSMVIRDLTLRSASSFGSFHLIRLLYDEYMFFLIEHKVAKAQNTTAIAVMSNKLLRDNEFEFNYPMDFKPEQHQNKRIKY